MSDALVLALVQLQSVPVRSVNLARVRAALAETAACDLAVFPECVLCLGHGASVRAAARTEAETCAELGALCLEARRAAVFGGVPIVNADGVRNAALVFDAAGRCLARYDKMHLFQLAPGSGTAIDETGVYAPGERPVAFALDGWHIGLSICYDLRFPELFRAYAGADLVLCTSAFTAETGRAHWEVLLRARAIENQCYVAGVGQCGTNPETGTRLHGHSLVVDPWGRIVAEAPGAGEQTLRVELTRALIGEVRTRLPALAHRNRPVTREACRAPVRQVPTPVDLRCCMDGRGHPSGPVDLGAFWAGEPPSRGFGGPGTPALQGDVSAPSLERPRPAGQHDRAPIKSTGPSTTAGAAPH